MTDTPKPLADQSPAELIKNRIALDAWLKHETKRLQEYFKPVADKIDAIDNELLARLNKEGCESFKTEEGTAYKSTLLNLKVEDRDKLIDFAMENWDEIGNELLIVSPQKEATRQYMETHEGKPPPGLSHSYFTRVNIRRT